jgi:hypothetical protein
MAGGSMRTFISDFLHPQGQPCRVRAMPTFLAGIIMDESAFHRFGK